jgi:hypothetical protein
MLMITITIDTNIVRDFLDPYRTGHSAAAELIRLDGEKLCEVRIVSRIKADIPHGPLRGRLILLDICERPAIPTIGQWGLSSWGDDFWATDEQGRQFDAMLQLIFPGADPNGVRHASRLNDVGHLLGHKLAGRDVFVSNDRAFLGRARQLHKEYSVRVLSCAGAVEFVKAHAGSNL